MNPVVAFLAMRALAAGVTVRVVAPATAVIVRAPRARRPTLDITTPVESRT